MRLFLALVLVVFGSYGCAKKPAPKAPAQSPAPDKTGEPAGAGNEAPRDESNKDSGSMQSDPCDGGESKGK
jgi:hypothetical protein